MKLFIKVNDPTLIKIYVHKQTNTFIIVAGSKMLRLNSLCVFKFPMTPAPGYLHKSLNRNYATQSTHASCHFCRIRYDTLWHGTISIPSTLQSMFPLREYELLQVVLPSLYKCRRFRSTTSLFYKYTHPARTTYVERLPRYNMRK